jgi:hypothetical protein
MLPMKKVVTRTSLNDPPRDREYWLSRPPEERLAAVEQLRQQAAAGSPDAEQGLQRVCRVTRLHRG